MKIEHDFCHCSEGSNAKWFVLFWFREMVCMRSSFEDNCINELLYFSWYPQILWILSGFKCLQLLPNDIAMTFNDNAMISNDIAMTFNDIAMILNDNPMISNDIAMTFNDNAMISNDIAMTFNDNAVCGRYVPRNFPRRMGGGRGQFKHLTKYD